jgi:hypothetical protein
MRAREKSEVLHGLRLGFRRRYLSLPSSAEAGAIRCSRQNERQKLQDDTPCTGFATPCVTNSSCLYLQLTLLRLPSDARDDRPSPGVIAQGDVLLILVLTSWTGNAVRRRVTDESKARTLNSPPKSQPTPETNALLAPILRGCYHLQVTDFLPSAKTSQLHSAILQKLSHFCRP